MARARPLIGGKDSGVRGRMLQKEKNRKERKEKNRSNRGER